MASVSTLNKLKQYENGKLRFSDEKEFETYDRHLVFDHVLLEEDASQRERFEAVSRSLRDLLTQRWLLTQKTHDRENAKRVYYLSMEFLIGRSLVNNIVNLGVEQYVRDDLQSDPMQNWTEMVEAEPDAGLGNGGLGRLAACFIDSLATLQIPAVGQGLRYEYGIFRQTIEGGCQVEQPDRWLAQPDPWEVARPQNAVEVSLGCTFEMQNGVFHPVPGHPSRLIGVPYDRPIVGYGGSTINTLRLWQAASPNFFDFREFSTGDFVGAVVNRVLAETVTRVLYPDDSTQAGQGLRFLQEYFLVCCSLADMVATFQRKNDDWFQLPNKVAIQLNDTHPAMAVAELMLILLDDATLSWEDAWELTTRTLAYTNHTLLPEALEKWPVRFFELVCPRLLEIVFEINRRFLNDVRQRYPNDENRVARMSLVDDNFGGQVRMANLAIIGTHSTNGVAAIHSRLLRTVTVKDFAEMSPGRFSNKTNGVTPRRWLKLANPALAKLITEAIGDTWVTDLMQLQKLRPLAADSNFRSEFRKATRECKLAFSRWLKASGHVVNPDSIFDSQVKRIHEYKRQLLNALRIIELYNQIRANPDMEVTPRTFLFAGKAAPAYYMAKLIIKFINNVALAIDRDPAVRERIKVVFVPDYSVTVAERLIPASDVSNQISTAGYEASGTSNMKFMMNGALTIGTRDGATIEMAEEAGEDNFFLFGLTADQVESSRGWYNPHWHYENEANTRAVLDMIASNHFSPDEPGIFSPIHDLLLANGDHYMVLADLQSYLEADRRLTELFRDQDAWATKAILNVAASGKFSSDRTIAEYAADIWNVEPCPVE
jgi:glycogen phosphorylase